MKIETNLPKTITRTLTFSSGKTIELTEDEFLEIQNHFYREGMRPATVTPDPFWEYFYKQDPLYPLKVT